MVNTSKIKWDLSEAEKAVFKWLNDNEFTGEVKRQYQTKIKCIVEKEGVSTEVDIPSSLTMDTVSDWLIRFEKDFKMQRELYELRERVKNVNASK